MDSHSNAKNQQGFTLIELVTVIVILGVLATSVTSFLGFGTQSYSDAADREEIISTARFIVERLNREVRSALPNSARVIAANRCLEFVPIVDSAIYKDIPVLPEPARNTIVIAPFASDQVRNSSQISVYALNSDDIYTNTNNGIIANFDPDTNSSLSPLHSADSLSETSEEVILTLRQTTQFNADSPTKRLYFIAERVSYCVVNNQVFRYQGYNSYIGSNAITGLPNAAGVLMADFVDTFLFQTLPATLQRNALVQVRFGFLRNSEVIVFNNEIQVSNVP